MIHDAKRLHDAEQKLIKYGRELIVQKDDLDRRQAEIERRELIENLRPVFEARAAQAQATAPTTTSLPPPRPRVAYVRGGGSEQWVKGRWVERDASYWDAMARNGGGR